jgi:hypothetical protein
MGIVVVHGIGSGIPPTADRDRVRDILKTDGSVYGPSTYSVLRIRGPISLLASQVGLT